MKHFLIMILLIFISTKAMSPDDYSRHYFVISDLSGCTSNWKMTSTYDRLILYDLFVNSSENMRPLWCPAIYENHASVLIP